MRLLMRVTLPADPTLIPADFPAQWRALLKRIGALSADAREQGRLQFVLLDIEPAQITSVAEAVFRLAGAKPDFLPQIAPPPDYGVRNY